MIDTNVSDRLFLTVDEQVRRLVAWMTEGVYEKEQLAAMALLCAVAGENIFLLGPPGTAKSLVARRLKGVMKDARSFEYLMSRFSTPDEIFGPISITRLKEDDSYERLTDGYLPTADVVFLDEIWKAGPSIQNTLLTAVNEHLYHNGAVTMRLPMKVLIAASNELPPVNEGLEALWDRFLVRMVSDNIESDDNFEKMLLSGEPADIEVDESIALTDELYTRWQTDARKVEVPRLLIEAIKRLRRSIHAVRRSDEEGQGNDYYVSDRRWKKAFRLMQASAFMNGRAEADESDLLLLIHCLWNSVTSRDRINALVTGSMWGEIKDELDAINERVRRIVEPDGGRRANEQYIPESEYKTYYNSYFAIDGVDGATALIPEWDYKKLSLIDETDGVKFNDNSLRLPVIQIDKNNTVFSLPANTGRPSRVKLMKCNGGIVINSIPYSLIRKGDRQADEGRGVTVRKDFAPVKHNFTSLKKKWNELKTRLSTVAARNIFVSDIDAAMLADSMNELDRIFTETGIRLKNVEKIIR
ncbi:MAG: AAA family ATPase [Duncaniella sp.]|nr:AAA family ATPase [Duncaniella sp.]